MGKSKKITMTAILQSRYGSEDDLPKWVEERRKVCDTCTFNSKNRSDLTLTEKAWVLANHGKDTCLACKCMISAKTKIDYAVCGLNSVGLEPKWNAIEDKTMILANLKIENISTTPLKVAEIDGEVVIDYGEIKIGQETDVRFLIHDEQDNMKELFVSASCGCTVPTFEKKDKKILLEIVYNTKRVGEFTKTVVFEFTRNKIDYKKVFKITGKTI